MPLPLPPLTSPLSPSFPLPPFLPPLSPSLLPCPPPLIFRPSENQTSVYSCHTRVHGLKADMKSYIPLETAAIFFLANLFPKQGISSEYVTADFICMGLLGLQGTKTENYNWKWKILAHTGTRTHDPWFSSLVPYPRGYPVWYINDNLKLL